MKNNYDGIFSKDELSILKNFAIILLKKTEEFMEYQTIIIIIINKINLFQKKKKSLLNLKFNKNQLKKMS